MKICVLTHCFYPSVQRGGPTVSMTNMVKAVADCGDVSVITVGFDKDLKLYTKVEMGLNKIFGCSVYYLTENSPWVFYRMLKKVNPDVIYISSLFSWQYSVSALVYAKVSKTRVILAPRGELMPSAIGIKSKQKKVFLMLLKSLGITKNVELHATSVEEENMVAEYFPQAQIWCIENLPSIIQKDCRVLHKKRGQLDIIMIGRIHPIKNVDKALYLLQDLCGDVSVSIYGTEEVTSYVNECKTIAKTLPCNIQVKFCGVVQHEQIQDVIRSHHILLSPTQSENFGQAIVETLLVGHPVVISDNTPWHGLEEKNAGFDISLHDMSSFQEALQYFVDMDFVEYKRWCEGASNYIREQLKVDDDISKYKLMFKG